MSRLIECDQCDELIDGNASELTWWCTDETGDEWMEEAHFCGWECLAAWAFARTLDDPPEPV